MTISNTSLQPSRLPKLLRVAKARPRLLISFVAGLSVFLALSLTDWRLTTRLLAGWDVCLLLYVSLVLHLAQHSDTARIKRRARLQDEGQVALLIFTAIAAFASISAIFVLLGSGGASRHPILLAFATITIVLSWAFTHTMFALHYAHVYYDENEGKGGGMEFPSRNDERPDYWDFLYFSFVIGMCAQVSDVTVSCKQIRRTTFAHSVISFFFNAALLAITVNIAAGAI